MKPGSSPRNSAGRVPPTGRTTVWDKQEHLFTGTTYSCRECGGRFDRLSEYCPGCRAKVVRIEYDPEWVDEIEFLEL